MFTAKYRIYFNGVNYIIKTQVLFFFWVALTKMTCTEGLPQLCIFKTKTEAHKYMNNSGYKYDDDYIRIH